MYDSVNARQLLDVKDYLVGVVLPPHLSPFIEEGEDDYIPPERVQLLQRAGDEGRPDLLIFVHIVGLRMLDGTVVLVITVI